MRESDRAMMMLGNLTTQHVIATIVALFDVPISGFVTMIAVVIDVAHSDSMCRSTDMIMCRHRAMCRARKEGANCQPEQNRALHCVPIAER